MVDETQIPMVKGSLFRGLSKALEQERLLGRLLPKIPASIAQRLTHPPLPTEWIEYSELYPVFVALDDVGGDALCRSIMRKSAEFETLPLLRSIIGGIIRLFGATPHTLFQRLNDIYRAATKGRVYSYERKGDCEGVLTLSFPAVRDIPLPVFVGISGALELVYGLVGAEGTVGDIAYTDSARRNTVRMTARWASKT